MIKWPTDTVKTVEDMSIIKDARIVAGLILDLMKLKSAEEKKGETMIVNYKLPKDKQPKIKSEIQRAYYGTTVKFRLLNETFHDVLVPGDKIEGKEILAISKCYQKDGEYFIDYEVKE